MGLVEPCAREHRGRPTPPLNVQPQRPGTVRHVGGHIAGHSQSHIIFWQQHLGHGGEYLWFVLTDPQKLGRGKSRHRAIAGDCGHLRHCGFELDALRGAAPIVPQDGWAERAELLIDQRGTVHLAREAYAPNCAAVRPVQKRDRVVGSRPPVRWILFRPKGLRPRDRQGSARLVYNRARIIDDRRLDRRGTHVDS